MLPTEERTILFVLLTFLPLFGHVWAAIVSKSEAQLRDPTAHHNQLMMSSNSSLLLNFDVKSYSPGLLTPLWKDKESFYTPVQIISNRGYPVQVHHVTTDDGYILELHRIPATSKNSKIVFFQHGVFDSSGTWLVNPSERCLPFLLADLGYDVWLGNIRGNRYSRTHVSLDPNLSSYWKFSWDEMGEYDIPAVINYILSQGNQSSLSYIGHSLGGAIFFIAMIKHPELNSKIDRMIGLAPLSSFAHFSTPILRLLCPIYRLVRFLYKLFTGTQGLLADNQGLSRFLLRLVCEETFFQALICRRVINFFIGNNVRNIDLSLIPRINSESMLGTSGNTVVQFAQNYNSGEVFQAFDYGEVENLERYGSIKPLIYDLKNVTAPVYMFAGTVDKVVAFQDTDWLATQLGNLQYYEKIEGYNHADFIWGNDVNERLYNKVIAILPSP